MDKDLGIVISNDDSDEKYFRVPIKREDFGNFITNLLGQPETITERKAGTFEATFEWLVHLHHLLDQRIKQQHCADLVDFSATFKYSDGPERKITTIDGFLNFNEAKLVTTKSIKITWTYLISFPNKHAPEKQEISLRLITDRAEVLTVGSASIIRHTTTKNGVMSYSIAHTERTWGDDIQSLLARETSSIFKKESRIASAFEVSVVFIALGLFAAGLIVPDYIEQLIRESAAAQLFLNAGINGKEISSLNIDAKLNLVISLLDPATQFYKVEAWYRVASFVVGVVLAAFTVVLFERETPSFIVITTEDRKKLSEHKRADKASFLKKTLSFAAAVGAGVAGNYLYYYLNL